MKLKKGDEVEVVVGKDKGKKGKIDKVFSKLGKVLIPNINTYKKHKKARLQNETSEIITINKPLPVSNVSFICPNCHKKARIGYKIDKKNKIRICKNCKKAI
jgi:large subunit ribosomal protein L24